MLGAIIGAVVGAATSIVNSLAVVGMAVQGIKAIGGAVISIGKALGIIKPERKVEELGDKAIQAEEQGIKPENFDKYEDYVKKIEEFEVDPEKSKQISEEEKIAKGTEIGVGLAIDKFSEAGIRDAIEVFSENPDYFTEARMSEILKTGVENKENLSNIVGFLNGKEPNFETNVKSRDMLIDIEKKVNPQISDNEAFNNVMRARQ